MTFFFFFLLTFIQLLIFLNTMENFTFFSFWSSKVNVLNFLELETAWIWWCNPRSSSVCYRRRFSYFYWNLSPKKYGCNSGTDLCQASHTIAMCWEIFPRIWAINQGFNGASLNLWECITWKKKVFIHEKKKCLTLKLGFHGLIR